MTEVTTQWIETKNAEFAQNNIPLDKRPLLVWREWYQAFGLSLPVDEALRQQDKVFSWYESDTTFSKQYIDWLFVGSFYYEAGFWRVCVPLAHGRVRLDAFDSLKTVPQEIKQKLWEDRGQLREFSSHWAACVDYAYGIDDLKRSSAYSPFSQQLLLAGDKHLISTISLLHQNQPSAKSMEDSRWAIEIFQKAYLAAKAGLTEADAKNVLRHDLNEGANRCISAGLSELTAFQPRFSIFPEVGERYSENRRTLGELWSAYNIAQSVAATVIRSLSGRDIRPSMQTNIDR